MAGQLTVVSAERIWTHAWRLHERRYWTLLALTLALILYHACTTWSILAFVLARGMTVIELRMAISALALRMLLLDGIVHVALAGLLLQVARGHPLRLPWGMLTWTALRSATVVSAAISLLLLACLAIVAAIVLFLSFSGVVEPFVFVCVLVVGELVCIEIVMRFSLAFVIIADQSDDPRLRGSSALRRAVEWTRGAHGWETLGMRFRLAMLLVVCSILLVPLIFIGLPVAMAALGLSYLEMRGERRSCLNCDYSLVGLRSVICPECGTPIDPAPADDLPTTAA